MEAVVLIDIVRAREEEELKLVMETHFLLLDIVDLGLGLDLEIGAIYSLQVIIFV